MGNLPFNYQQPMLQIMQFRLDSPPFVPPIQDLPAETRHLLVPMSSVIANEAGRASGASAARMFTYNQLSSNNWANREFEHAVRFGLDLLYINVRKGLYRSADQGLQDAATSALSLLTSVNVHNYPGLKSLIPQDVVHSAMQNVQTYNNIMNEINATRGGSPVMYPQAHPQPYNYPQYPSQGQPMGQPMGMPQQQFYQNPQYPQYPGQGQPMGMPGYPQQGPVFVQQGTAFGQPPAFVGVGVTDNPINQSRYFRGGDGQRPQPQQPMRLVPEEPVKQPVVRPPEVVVKKQDWRPSVQQSYRTLIDTTRFVTEYKMIAGERPFVLEYVEPQEVPMDRAKHTLTRFGVTYGEDNTKRAESLEMAAVSLFKIKGEDITKACEDDEVAVMIEEFVSPKTLVETFEEDLIFQGRLLKDQMAVGEAGIYRIFGKVAVPYICDKNYDDIVDKLREAPTFNNLASKIKYIARAAAQTSDETIHTPGSIPNFLTEIDKRLTKIVNDFLNKKVSLSTKIESFTEDVEMLGSFLEEKYGSMYHDAFVRFERDVVAYIFDDIEQEGKEVFRENLTGISSINGHHGSDLTFLTETYSVTYVNVDESELTINAEKDETLLIKESVTPVIYRIAKSVFEQNSALQDFSLNNLLITQDGVKFEIHKGYIGQDAYILVKV